MFPYKSFKSIFSAICFAILPYLLVGCSTARINPSSRNLLEWKYSDLKLIDPIDAVDPGQDMVAAYVRMSDHSLQLRIDFLDLEKFFGKDIYIPIDTNPGGETQIITNNNGHLTSDVSWDYLIKITVSGKMELFDHHLSRVNGLQFFIEYDEAQDRMIIDVIRSGLPTISGQTKFQVIVTSSGDSEISDKSEPFTVDSPSPTRVKVLFAFWNTFTSDTPAQTLRSWAGAHAGPMSSRHGLKYLVDAADRTNSTIFLLDLLSPKNISALDYLNVLPRIRKLSAKGILGLPEVAFYVPIGDTSAPLSWVGASNQEYRPRVYPAWIVNNNLINISMQSNSNFVYLLKIVKYLYSIDVNVGGNDYAQSINIQNPCELQPNGVTFNLFKDSMSIDCKILLLSYAYDRSTSPVILGGDFSKSMLGDPAMSTQVFSFIADHPWIQVVTIQDIVTTSDLLTGLTPVKQDKKNVEGQFPQQSSIVSPIDTTGIQSEVYNSIVRAPHNQLTDLAWQVYDSFLAPAPPELLSLRKNYIGQIGEILAAADWAGAPTKIQTCALDLDHDSINECILANDQIFAVIERYGGYVSFVFTNDGQGIHQIIGPTWEFFIGVSDSSFWNTSSGVRADSEQILGIFPNQFDSWKYYDTVLSDGKIELVGEKMTMRKSVSIYPDKIRIDIQGISSSQLNLSIPLVVDPWHRYTPHWGYSYTGVKVPFGYIWGINHGQMVGIFSKNQLTAFPFNATHKALALPEDPNFDYSRGHFLPYPMALVDVASSDNISVDIIINP